MKNERISVIVRINDTAYTYEFTKMWQVEFFVKFLNITAKLFDWIYGVKR